MLHELGLDEEFFSSLTALDAEIARRVAVEGCPRCGGPLHIANYPRKPLGGMMAAAAEAFTIRHSLCCGKDRRWVAFVKGGRSVQYYTRNDLVLRWENNGSELQEWIREYRIKHPGQYIKNQEFYFRPGVTWPRASWRTRRFGHVAADCLFADKGSMIFGRSIEPYVLTSLLNSSTASVFMLAQTPERMWEVGTISALPIPPAATGAESLSSSAEQLEELTLTARYAGDETCRDFALPDLRRLHHQTDPIDLTDLLKRWRQQRTRIAERERDLLAQLDEQVASLLPESWPGGLGEKGLRRPTKPIRTATRKKPKRTAKTQWTAPMRTASAISSPAGSPSMSSRSSNRTTTASSRSWPPAARRRSSAA
jgi:hypothetical protein